MEDNNTEDNEKARTLFVGNLHSNVTEDILYELFLQVGPIQRVNIPKGKAGGYRNFGFITYYHPVSVPYAIELFAETSLFNRKLLLKPSTNAKNNEPKQLERPPTRMQQMYSNNSLRQGGSNSGLVNRMSHMEPTMNPIAFTNVLENQFDPMMLVAMGTNLLGSLTNALGKSNNLDGRIGGNSDSLKMKTDRSHSNSNLSEPYNRRPYHNRRDRSRDNEQDRYDRGGRDRRNNRNRR